MTGASGHWTADNISNFIYRIASDFVVQLEKRMDAEDITQKQLAEKLGVSVGRVSQVLNNPGNLTLKKIVEYARVLGLKVSVVAYNDGDATNNQGPVNSEIFQICWNQAGRPRDFFALSANTESLVGLKHRTARYVPITTGGMFNIGQIGNAVGVIRISAGTIRQGEFATVDMKTGDNWSGLATTVATGGSHDYGQGQLIGR